MEFYILDNLNQITTILPTAPVLFHKVTELVQYGSAFFYLTLERNLIMIIVEVNSYGISRVLSNTNHIWLLV